jgi:hypothetical protein
MSAVSVPPIRMREHTEELRPTQRLGLDSLLMSVAKTVVGLLGVPILIARRPGPAPPEITTPFALANLRSAMGVL